MPDMNCTEFETQLNQLVEDHRSFEEFADDASCSEAAIWRDLRGHANGCPRCRQLWNEFALLERVLPLCKDLTPQVDLADAVIARWRKESAAGPAQTPHPPSPNGRSLFPFLLVIAATVLACFAFLFSPREQDDLPDTVPIATLNQQDGPDPAALRDQTDREDSAKIDREPELDWQTIAQEAGSAYWALASDTADSFATVAVFAPAINRSAETPAPDPVAKSSAGWTQGIGTGLKPIRRDLGQAMEFLFEALPGENTL